MSKVLVAGSGYVGRNLHLRRRGDEVRALARSESGGRPVPPRFGAPLNFCRNQAPKFGAAGIAV